VAGEVKGFDPAVRVGVREARRLGLFMVYAVAAADEAMARAGFRRDGAWPARDAFGVWLGSGIGGFPEICVGAERFPTEGPDRVSPFFIPRSLIHLGAGQLSIRFAAAGPSHTLASACAAGNHAIGEAWRAIRDGTVDVALCGGAEASLHAVGYAGFQNMGALTRRNDDAVAACRPFDADRDGFVMAEGAGLLVLEEESAALRRGAPILARVAGYGATSDAHHITAPAPFGEGAARAMRTALASSGFRAEDVDYINAHGTGTPANDPAEVAAIRSVFGRHADRLAVSSTKGCTGHLLGAAGGVEAVATVLALHRGVLPPTANLHRADPACDLDHVPLVARRTTARVAISNAFGFGGTNAVLVFAA
jgi:3-oxoacyl-[acyl-carrier-protein] synthase II